MSSRETDWGHINMLLEGVELPGVYMGPFGRGNHRLPEMAGYHCCLCRVELRHSDWIIYVETECALVYHLACFADHVAGVLKSGVSELAFEEYRQALLLRKSNQTFLEEQRDSDSGSRNHFPHETGD